MRVNALPSTGKSSKQTQQRSLLVVVGLGGGGLELRLSPCPMEELDAVDVVSLALAVASLGSLGFEERACESITVATAPGNEKTMHHFFPRLRGGICRVFQERKNDGIKTTNERVSKLDHTW